MRNMSEMIKMVQLYERRIENAYTARDNCKTDSWGYNYWEGVAGHLLHSLNTRMHSKNLRDIKVEYVKGIRRHAVATKE